MLTWDSPIYITSLVGLYGSALLFWIVRMYKNNPGKLITIPIIFLICAGVLLIHPISSEYDKSTQGGSLFLVAQYLPTLFSTPIIYWILFPIGSIYLFILARQLASNQNYVMIIAFTFWLLTYTVAFRTWQKYYEPFILFGLGYSVMTTKGQKWYYWLGPIVLLIGFVGIDLIRFY